MCRRSGDWTSRSVPVGQEELYPYTVYTAMEMARKPGQSQATSAIPTRFSKPELARMDRARNLLGLPSRSALIREAVLARLGEIEETKVIELRDMTIDEAIRLIDRYLKGHPGRHYVSDVSEELGIELKVAFEAADRLISRGRARVGRE